MTHKRNPARWQDISGDEDRNIQARSDNAGTEHRGSAGDGHEHGRGFGHSHRRTDGHGHSHGSEDRHGAGHRHGAHDDHDHPGGLRGALREIFVPHSHDAADSVDDALEASAVGIRAVKISLGVLGVTAVLQMLIVVVSGSVALAADTIHNFSDALTAVPLWIAFALGRRAATRRYTYGFGRAEDLAGLFVVGMITLSAIIAGYEAVRRLLDPVEIQHLSWVAAAGLIGFLGNETVALYRIRVGRRIGSAALVADGLHARTDGFTSLAVLIGAGGVALGFPLADPIVGLLITVAILAVLRTAARDVFRRLMDGVEPALVSSAEQALVGEPGVVGVRSLRMRWIGHRLHADVELDVAPTITLADAHRLAHGAEHTLTHAVPKLDTALVHAYPAHSPA
ncbi:cation diffusion facilitator family transporter [Nocardia sp. NBC_00565]|uniref:cation diffusion facilitator family transporter n=1 Tax=Nocardia sp. NBC_00565 TaxID=2975993 RepID=UPI002E7FD7A5|nr:cation diffusion facilitator family transporter [Nocardia sp. NBC_00565]WUC02767.1 cation diffusion facilitator family transporter [Nocardia sp. NBC_00565]